MYTPVSYTHLDVYKRQHKTSGNLIVNGYAEGKPTSFTADMGATVSIMRPDLVSNLQSLISSCTIQTVTGSPVKILGKVDVRVRLGLLKFSHQMLVADIVDDVILGTDIMNAYGFIVDLREDVLKVGQDKIKLCMAKMTGSANHALSLIHISFVH